MVGNLLVRQKIGIRLGIDPASLRANLSVYTNGKEYMSELISHDKHFTKNEVFH